MMLYNRPSVSKKLSIDCYCGSKMPAKICKTGLQRIKYTKYFVLTVDIMYVIMCKTV